MVKWMKLCRLWHQAAPKFVRVNAFKTERKIRSMLKTQNCEKRGKMGQKLKIANIQAGVNPISGGQEQICPPTLFLLYTWRTGRCNALVFATTNEFIWSLKERVLAPVHRGEGGTGVIPQRPWVAQLPKQITLFYFSPKLDIWYGY